MLHSTPLHTLESDSVLIERLLNRLEENRRKNAEEDLSEDYEDIQFGSASELGSQLQVNKFEAGILIFALVPTIKPKISWLYREFQSGDNTGQPGIDLIIELLMLPTVLAVEFRNLVSYDSELVTRGYIEINFTSPYHTIRPTTRLLKSALGVQPERSNIPGAVYIRINGIGDKTVSESLVCSKEIKKRLENVSKWNHHHKVLKDWNIHVDHGLVILLSGPSGTGKTMAAQAIAELTDMPLYRVDMGLMVSKYIGDTPKNINSLFDHAAQDNVVLLFDEAEGLFGKRGKVEDARDRYANMEVGHLLSRIERYPGICILTTNLKHHIDSAFLRRIDMVISFPNPDRDQSKELWKNYLGKLITENSSVPGILANNIEFSAAQIASTCRYAARLLLHELQNRKRPSKKKLLQALSESIWNELNKSGQGTSRASLGELEEYLPRTRA